MVFKTKEMRKHFFVVVIMFFTNTSRACDICGCGVGGSYIGLLPDFQKKVLGLRYRYSTLLSHIGAGGSATYLTTSERYYTGEFWAGWNIKKNLRLMLSVPFGINERVSQGVKLSKNGIADISALAFYQLFNKSKTTSANKMLVQTIWLGGGIKLPAGKYISADQSTNNQNSNLFQLGTGSVDFSANIMYDLRIQDAGFNISGSYKMNTANKYGYRYGNKFAGSVQAYHKFKINKQITVAPNTGIAFEKSGQDTENKFVVFTSGGKILYGTIGMENRLGKISVGINWQTPLQQKLANGVVKSNNRLMIHLSMGL